LRTVELQTSVGRVLESSSSFFSNQFCNLTEVVIIHKMPKENMATNKK
jgi:hypothetical protein